MFVLTPKNMYLIVVETRINYRNIQNKNLNDSQIVQTTASKSFVYAANHIVFPV